VIAQWLRGQSHRPRTVRPRPLFVALAVALPLPEDWAMLIVGVALLVAAVVCAGLGYRKFPRKPMSKTRKRIQEDVAMVRSGWHA